MTNHRQQVKIITPQERIGLRKPLSESWSKAAGLLQHKRKALGQHLKKIRLEWDHAR